MRIDTFNKVNQLYQATNPSKTVKSEKTGKSDKFEISQMGRDYQLAKAAVAAAPDIREDKVNDIKSRMEAGTYQVDSWETANKLVEDHLEEVN